MNTPKPRVGDQVCSGANHTVSFVLQLVFLDLKRPRLPRITRCPSGEPLESGPSRAEKGTTPSAGNAHRKAHRYPIESLFRWALRAHRFPSKSPSIPIGTTFGWAVGEPRRCDRFRAFVNDHLASARLIGCQKRSQIIRQMIRRSVRCTVLRLISRTIHRAVQIRS